MRLRVTFSKTGPLIFIGNLDLLTIWERAARRAGLALQYSKGFHPQPKIQFAAPLPLGFSSSCEMVDIRIDEEADCAQVSERLQAVLPAGLAIHAIEAIDPAAPALAALLRVAEYDVALAELVSAAHLEESVTGLVSESSLPRERRGKRYDLRPLIESLELTETPGTAGPVLRMRLKAMQGATGRPDEVLEALGLKRQDARIERTALIFG